MNRLESFLASDFFERWPYRDCWFSKSPFPKNLVDCFLPDNQPGPSVADVAIVPEPPGLEYFHLSPKLKLGALKSGQSMIVGMRDGELVTASLMVHRETEAWTKQTALERVDDYYEPFVRAVSGAYLGVYRLIDLYEQALAGVPGMWIEDEGWIAVVQRWDHHRDCNIHVVEAFDEFQK